MELPRVRFTVRWLMIAIGCIGIGLSSARWIGLLVNNTVYSTGYSESRFRMIRVGMTPNEVETLMGPPLSKGPYWVYTDQYNQTRNYWRRWVIFEGGKVAVVVCDYWED